jgi:hypothetical protein
MWFMYGELLVLMLVSFVVGSLLAAIAMRLIVRKTAEDVVSDEAPPTPAPGSSP